MGSARCVIKVQSEDGSNNGSNGDEDSDSNGDFLFSGHGNADRIVDQPIVADNSLGVLAVLECLHSDRNIDKIVMILQNKIKIQY